MHEYPLTRQIIQRAEFYAKERGASRITALNLVIGDDSGCAADCLKLYFDIIAEGTLCQGASLNIERIAPALRCKVCGKLFKRKPFEFKCDEENCPGEGEPTEIGKEFYIKSISIGE